MNLRYDMLVALRAVRRERLYTALNVAGLALGIACCLILGLYLKSELTYDRHHVRHAEIYRIATYYASGGTGDEFAYSSRVMAPILKEQHPEVRDFVRFTRNAPNEGFAMRYEDKAGYWSDVYVTDTNVFDVFTHQILYGDPKTALEEGTAIAVSRRFAETYFGDENPVGKSMSTDSGVPLKITLVFEDLPPNTHLRYDVLQSSNSQRHRDTDNPSLRLQQLWGINTYTYLVLEPNFPAAEWQRINDAFYERNMASLGAMTKSEARSWLQPLADIHMDSSLTGDRPTGNRLYLIGATAVALFILAVACINYMNLATARAARRARSVGIRKILGASRGSLALQFLAESVFFCLLALVLGVVLVEVVLTLTPLNSLMGGQVRLDLLHRPQLGGLLVGLAVLMGLLAGAYPAIYLSSWAPLTALSGQTTAGKGSLRLREGLVLLQFTISAAVIASTLLMAAQMRYVANKPLGFQKENKLVVNLRGAELIEQLPTLRRELAKNSHVLGTTWVQVMLGQDTPRNVTRIETEQGVIEPTQITHMPIGEDFVQVMKLNLLEGRDIGSRLLTDVGQNFLVNEAMVRKMGWSQPLGKRIQLGNMDGRVVGVVQDFNYESLRKGIEPFLLYATNEDLSQVPPLNRPFIRRQLVVSISDEDVPGTIAHIEKTVQSMSSRHPFQFSFFDQDLDQLYKAERQLTQLTAIFATVCIFIACLGLFGLAAFTTEQRTREIGTRKVLGATTMQIILLLARRVLVLVLVAAVLAAGLAWFAVDAWLGGFAYRAPIDPLAFLLAAAIAAAIAFATVALQSWRTASSDPVHTLRHV